MDRQKINQLVYVFLMILVMLMCVGFIFYIVLKTNSCNYDPIKFFMDYIEKSGAVCNCAEGIKL